MIYLFIFRDRGEGREKVNEWNIDARQIHRLVASLISSVGSAASRIGGDLAQSPGMTRNQTNQPFGSQVNAQSTEPHQAGHGL